MPADASPVFFPSAGPFRLQEIASRIGADLAGEDKMITAPAGLAAAGAGEISFFASRRYLAELKASNAGACIISAAGKNEAPSNMALLVVSEPQRVWPLVLAMFYPSASEPPSFWQREGEGVSSAAHIHPEARLASDVVVEPAAVIGAGASIGAGSRICAGAVIGYGVQVGRECYISANVSLVCALLGDRVFIHAGASIGQDGLGYQPDAENGIAKVPQTGRVIIQNDVEIGANTTIDRASAGDTIVGEGTKIDNMVHLAHNVVIGRHCIIAAQTGFAGSVVVGDNVQMGGQSGIAGHLRIGSGVILASRAGVTRSLSASGIYGGFPAMPAGKWRREVTAVRQLAARRKP